MATQSPIYTQVTPVMYAPYAQSNPYAVPAMQPAPTARSMAPDTARTSPVPAPAPQDYEERGQPSARAPSAPPSKAAPAQSKASMLGVYAALCLILFVTIPTLALAAYAVDRINNTFLPGSGSSASVDLSGTAKENYKRWNDALQTKDYEKVAALYSTQELSFLPTVSPNFIRDNNSAKEYFKDFLKKLPFGTVTSEQTQSFGTDAYLHSGMYTFQLGPLDNRSPVDARFSYVWRKMNGEWKITHHHSSVKPSGRRSGQAALLQAEAEAVGNFMIGNDALSSSPKK